MKLAEFFAIAMVLAVLFAVPAFAQDTGVLDTVRWVPESTTWTINSAEDSLFSIELFGWTDQSMTGISIGFKIPTSTGGGSGRDDSLIVVDTFDFTMSTSMPVPWGWSAVDSARFANPYIRHSEFNGCLLGRIYPTFPLNTSTKIGDLIIKIPDPTMLPNEFDIAIDSVFFPPAGYFKFSPGSGSGYPPEYVGATIHVDNIVLDADDDLGEIKPESYRLNQNTPNPFNPSTTISFYNEAKGHVNLAIYNLLGQKVKTLIDWEMAPGQQDVLWDGTDNNSENVSSGIYFYRLSAGDFHDIKKMMLLK
jgi:hypothetical protein